MAMKERRSLKVQQKSAYNYRPIPAIVLKGDWLQAAGFAIGDYISVNCEDEKLVITQDQERAALDEAEADFMEKGMRELRRQFEVEKAAMQERMVAEKQTKYGGQE